MAAARPPSRRRGITASLAALALAQLAVPAPARPMMTMTASLCGSGRTVPLPVPKDDGPDGGERDKPCQMPCHGVDRRRKGAAG